jgi:Icc-related predicted phosphoesterase
MMRIVCISDTHLRHDLISVPDGDILIHAGDSTMAGRIEEMAAFNAWLGTLPHKHKIIIAGNHDLLFQHSPTLARSLITNAIYLEDSLIEVEGLKIYGSPWQPWFMNWAFNLERGDEIRRKWDLIPQGVDILITHGPPYYFLDLTADGQRAGCEELAEYVARLKPKAHIFGHIHEGYGVQDWRGIKFINASICDERYRPINAPIVFEIEPDTREMRDSKVTHGSLV